MAEAGLCTAPPEVCAGVWAEEIPEELLISEPELFWEGGFNSHISEGSFAESHLGRVSKSRNNPGRRGGELSKGSTTNDGSRAGKIHRRCSRRGPPYLLARCLCLSCFPKQSSGCFASNIFRSRARSARQKLQPTVATTPNPSSQRAGAGPSTLLTSRECWQIRAAKPLWEEVFS